MARREEHGMLPQEGEAPETVARIVIEMDMVNGKVSIVMMPSDPVLALGMLHVADARVKHNVVKQFESSRPRIALAAAGALPKGPR